MEERAHILVVEDDHDLRSAICEFLSSLGYLVTQAKNGNVAIAMIGNKKPALMITDILMPEKEGISTIVDIRRQMEEIKIIAMSGGGRFGRVDVLNTAKKLGADGVLAKPFEMNDLQTLVEEVLSKPSP